MKTYATLAFVALMLAGCTPQPEPKPAGPDYYARGAWAWSIAIEQPSTPQPKPQPTGTCDNCHGTGKLGDGTVSVPCPVCGGDGRIDDGAGPVEDTDEQQAEKAPQQPAARQQNYQQGRRRGPIGRAIFGN